jgi:hypothetical protein
MKRYPKWFNKKLIIGIFATSFLSGLLLAPTTLQMRLQFEVPWRLLADLRAPVALVHSLFGLLMFWLLGSLSTIHIQNEWKTARKRYSGLSLTILWIFLGMTGIGIYYVSGEAILILTSVGHLFFGILLLFYFLWHVFFQKAKK